MADFEKPTSEKDASFLKRWSRRKASARDAESGGEVAMRTEADGALDIEAAPLPTADSGEITPAELAELEEIDLDTLSYEADFTPFMKKGVPPVLRQAALRKLWRLNPVFANLDGLNEYDENYRVVHKVLENIQTAYKVGEGYLTKAERAAMAGEPLPDQEGAELTGEDASNDELAGAKTMAEEECNAKREASPQSAAANSRATASSAGIDDLDEEDFA